VRALWNGRPWSAAHDPVTAGDREARGQTSDAFTEATKLNREVDDLVDVDPRKGSGVG
jgi:hypothetical protein